VAGGEWCRLLASRGSKRHWWLVQLQWSFGARNSLFEWWDCQVPFSEKWFRKDAVPVVATSVTLGSPSDNTTPRCQMVARGWFLPLPNPQSIALGAVGRGGLVGARQRHQIQQHLSDATAFSGSH